VNSDDTDSKRTLSQNSKMWPMLTDFSRQKKWRCTVAGTWVMKLMPPAHWKAVLTAAFAEETEMAEGWTGGVVMLGESTSNYGVKRMADFITWLYANGNEVGIVWSEKSEHAHRMFGAHNYAKKAA